MGGEIYIGVVSVLIVFMILGIIIPLLIVNYKRKQEKYLQEKIWMQNQFEQELLKTQLETQEETFYQISEELHDNIGQMLTSSKMMLNVGKSELQQVPNALVTAEEILCDAIRDLRSLTKSLNKEWLNHFNLVDNLRLEAARISSSKSIGIELCTTVHALPIAAEAQVVLFRIVQEALQNSIKHGKPRHVIIGILQSHQITVTIADDGGGFDVGQLSQDGIGLMTMKHRARLLGGSIEWKSIPGKGTEVCISLPLQPAVLQA